MKRYSWALPYLFALAGAATMLPALKTPLVMDDLPQRIPQLDPADIPPALNPTGFVPDRPGTLATVLTETFGFPRDRARAAAAKNYGLLPWWLPEGNFQAALFRPVTAFTHWLDYRLFPNTWPLMHAHSIAWFAAAVALATVIYRRLLPTAGLAALAGAMFLLDKNTYFPVMFVANRGFIVALALGLTALLCHHRWRSTRSPLAAAGALIFLALSLLANEAGVSTFAFLLAYALTLDPHPWPKRLGSLLPAIAVIILWRIVYQSLGYGVDNLGNAYLDPGHEPLKFLTFLPTYSLAIVAGQLSGLPPDAYMAVATRYAWLLSSFYLVFTIIALALFYPLLRTSKPARFFFAALLFAAIPIVAAPSGKNFGFIAVAAFGLIALFIAAVVKKSDSLPTSRLYRLPAWAFCILLLIVHLPASAMSKLVAAKYSPKLLNAISNPNGLNSLALSEDQHLFIVNAPCHLSTFAIPFNAAYYNRPIPKSIHVLACAYARCDIERTDEYTLTITCHEKNFFTPTYIVPVHSNYAFAASDQLFFNPSMFEPDTYPLETFTAKILERDENHLPKKVAYTFHLPLDHPTLNFAQFQGLSYKPFLLPTPNQTTTLPSPCAHAILNRKTLTLTPALAPSHQNIPGESED